MSATTPPPSQTVPEAHESTLDTPASDVPELALVSQAAETPDSEYPSLSAPVPEPILIAQNSEVRDLKDIAPTIHMPGPVLNFQTSEVLAVKKIHPSPLILEPAVISQAPEGNEGPRLVSAKVKTEPEDDLHSVAAIHSVQVPALLTHTDQGKIKKGKSRETSSRPGRDVSPDKTPNIKEDSDMSEASVKVEEDSSPDENENEDEEMHGDEMSDEEMSDKVMSENDDLDEDMPDRDDGEYVPAPVAPIIKNSAAPKDSGKAKQRQRPAKTAREYFARKFAGMSIPPVEKPSPRAGHARRGGVRRNAGRKSGNRKAIKALGSAEARSELLHPAGEQDGDSALVEQPMIIATTKLSQLDQMFAACKHRDFHQTDLTRPEFDEMIRSFGIGMLKAKNGGWQPKGMTVSLLNHQVMGVSWMLGRECSLTAPFGGILADTMGLGKTTQAITLMVMNPPPYGTPSDQLTTLIVVPSQSMISQWEDEIDMHARATLKHVTKYKKGDKLKLNRITGNDVVLTTYQQLWMSLPNPGKQELASMKKLEKEGWDLGNLMLEWVENHRQKGGALHQIKWYRIILDEGHAIKNHKSTRSIAAAALQGNLRWILTGTPLANDLEEFGAQFRFIKHPGYNNHTDFKSERCDPGDPRAIEKLGADLTVCMKRQGYPDERTGHHTILGVKVLNLPKSYSSVKIVRLTAQERVLYDAVKERFQERLEEDAENHDASNAKQKNTVPQMRLRHHSPSTPQKFYKPLFSINQMQALVPKLQSEGTELADHMLVLIAERIAHPEHLSLFSGAEGICMLCGADFQDPQMINVAKCKHIYCRVCIELYIEEENNRAMDAACPECSAIFDFSDLVDFVSKSITDWEGSPSQTSAKKFSRGKDMLGHVPAIAQSSWLEQADAGKVNLLTGAKIAAALEQTSEWQIEAPEDKIIIFGQFITGMVLMGRGFRKAGIGYVYFTGDMTSLARSNALKKFKSDPKCMVIIATLSCGGLGLNLAIANQVIILDLWFNTTLESQAFGRVVRIGQIKETFLVRIAAEDTIDTRVLEMQNQKEELICTAMNDKCWAEIYLGLFGRVTKDSNGKTQVIREYQNHDDI